MAISHPEPGTSDSARGQRGMSLIEIMVVMAIAALLLAGFIFFAHSGYERAGDLSALSSALDHAEAIARSSGNGATIAYFASSDPGVVAQANGYVLLVCAGRPNGVTFATCTRETPQPGSVSVAPPAGMAITDDWAIYVDPAGSVAAGSWPSNYTNTTSGAVTPVASEPSCPAGSSITVTFSGGEASSTGTIDCATGTFSYQRP
jgi:prepilin-type N-terminal cleavage/methylation domain-containing protein